MFTHLFKQLQYPHKIEIDKFVIISIMVSNMPICKMESIAIKGRMKNKTKITISIHLFVIFFDSKSTPIFLYMVKVRKANKTNLTNDMIRLLSIYIPNWLSIIDIRRVIVVNERMRYIKCVTEIENAILSGSGI